MPDMAERLVQRAALSGLTVAGPLVVKFTAYLHLLERWNEKINLTSLVDPDEAVDRLILEPLAAAARVPSGGRLIDLGSGGGSPAIPLALASGAAKLVMVESRERKAAFLREAIRHLGLSPMASVEARRFEELAEHEDFVGAFDMVSIRAVRTDLRILATTARFLAPSGLVALFRGPSGAPLPEGLPSTLAHVATVPLLKQSNARLTLLRRA